MSVTAGPSAAPSGEAAGEARMRASTPALGGSGIWGLSGLGGGRVYYGRIPVTGTPQYGGSVPLTPTAGAPGRDSVLNGSLYDNQKTVKGSRPKWLTPDEAYADFYNWGANQQRDFIAAGVVSGQLQSDAGIMEAGAWWKKLVAESARFGAAGQEVSPMDILGSYVSAAGGLGGRGRKGNYPNGAIFGKDGAYTGEYRDGEFIVNTITGQRRYVGAKFKTTTATRVDITDPNTARAIAQGVFQSLLGRDPGPGEIAQFAGALSQAEQGSPTTDTTVHQYNGLGEEVAAKTTASGGVTAEGRALLATDQAKANPEFGATQAATTYMDAVHRAIWGTPGG